MHLDEGVRESGRKRKEAGSNPAGVGKTILAMELCDGTMKAEVEEILDLLGRCCVHFDVS